MQTVPEKVNDAKVQTQRPVGFCQKLSASALADLTSMKFPKCYPLGEVLFTEQRAPTGVFLIREGKVKLSINSSDGKRLSLRIAKAGEVLGLTATLSGNSCEATAETITPARIIQISSAEFLSFLARHAEVYKFVTEEVTQQYNMACEQLRTVGLCSSAPEKLARLLLDLSEKGQTTENCARFRFLLTHEQVGEFIGASRETVTRTLGSFKLRHLVAVHGSTITIPSVSALQDLCA
jgi:CRP/FNR family cyclic AMP-dependent transcriptional regulator